MLRRPAFTLEETTGNFTGCVGFFLIVDGKGEEVLTGFNIFCANSGTQHHGFTVGDNHCAIGLAGNFTCFEY